MLRPRHASRRRMGFCVNEWCTMHPPASSSKQSTKVVELINVTKDIEVRLWFSSKDGEARELNHHFAPFLLSAVVVFVWDFDSSAAITKALCPHSVRRVCKDNVNRARRNIHTAKITMIQAVLRRQSFDIDILR